MCPDLKNGGSQVAGVERARGRRMVGNEAGPGHVAHVGCVQDFDFFSRSNVKPLKSLNFKVNEEKSKWTF